MQEEISFVPLLVVIGLAFLVPLFLSRIKGIAIPVVVGEIIAGIIVGKSGFRLVEENFVLEVLAILGFAYLMFLSGLEINFSDVLSSEVITGASRLRRWTGNPMVIGGALFFLTLTGSTIAAFFLRSRGLINDPWIMALILSTTSLGVVVPVLKERDLTTHHLGQTILVSSLVADFVSILLISVYVLLQSQGLTLDVLLVLVLLVAFVVVYRLAARLRRHLPAARIFEELSSATSQIKLRGSFALALVFIALAESLGIENILGAFLAGVIVSLLSPGEGSILRQKLDAVGYGFFIPIFFIMVGVGFDLPALLGSRSALLLVPLLIGIAYAVKLVPALIYRVRYSWRETLAAGFLLSSRLSLIIAAAAIGLQLGAISDAVNSTIILVAIITCTLSPIVFNRVAPDLVRERDRVLVAGTRKSVALLTRRLREHNLDAILLSGDNHQHHQALAMGIPSVCRPCDSLSNALREAGITRAKAVVAMEERDEDNLRICRMARQVYGVENIVSWVRDPVQNDRFRRLGVRVVNPAYSTVLIMESMVLSPDAFSLTADVDETRAVQEVKLQNRDLIGRRLRDLSLPGDVIVLMIQRGGDILVPDRKTSLRANDTVTLVGTDSDLDAAARLFARNGR
ncbi:MAG: monovalent cation:proton antiporter family protein [Anaerolineae bacterium]